MSWSRFFVPTFRSRSPKRRRRSRPAGVVFRPQLEPCENRLLPSTFTVTDLGDAGMVQAAEDLLLVGEALEQRR